MSEPITFTVQMSFDDYLAANKAVLLRAWSIKAIVLALLRMAVIVSAVFLVAAAISRQSPLPWFRDAAVLIPIAGAATLAFCFVWQFASLKKSARKMFEQLGTVDLPTDYDLTTERFKSKFAQGESMHPWTQFVDYVETDHMLLIRRTAGLFFGIPKKQLDAETLARVQTLLQTVGLKRA